MKALRIPLLGVLLSAGLVAQAVAAPVVVELFQSQGCSSCPPANANLNALAGRDDILALSFAITYWDQLGWKDTFASPQFTARQWDYARGLKHDNVYTPQMVIDGRFDLVGTDAREVEHAIAHAVLPDNTPSLSLSGSRLAVGAGAAAPADVWLVRYDPRVQQVAIGRGENAGRTLPHRNIVRALTRLGSWSGAAQSYDLPPTADPAFKTAILLQRTGGGPILAALKL